MFNGTPDKLNPKRRAMIVLHEANKYALNCRVPNTFTLLLLKRGTMTAVINEQICHFQAPTILCLDELKGLCILQSSVSDLRIVTFDPTFLNVNMKISTIRDSRYSNLCDQHALFQLSPFLASDSDKFSYYLTHDTLSRIDYFLDMMDQQLQNQPDWYWSCRARSYFIDIINILERKYFNFYIEDGHQSTTTAKISQNFIEILTYINNHLDEQHSFESLYDKFYINKNHVGNLFKTYLNTTFYDYLCKRRFEEASYYLRFTELSGEMIASRVGFSSSQNFCRFFKSQCGKTPNEFRKDTVSKRKTDETLLKLHHLTETKRSV